MKGLFLTARAKEAICIKNGDKYLFIRVFKKMGAKRKFLKKAEGDVRLQFVGDKEFEVMRIADEENSNKELV